MKKEYLIYKLSEEMKEATRIDNELFPKFDVKRGLRNEDGTGAVSYTHLYQFLANPVHSRITLGADQHLRFAVKRFVNGFHERGSLSGSRRAVNDGDIACA